MFGLNRTAITVIIAIAAVVAFTCLFPVEHRSVTVEGFFWRMTSEVINTREIIAEGPVVPAEAVLISTQTLYDKSTCPPREDDCIGTEYTLSKFKLTFSETTRSLTSFGYDQNPIPPTASLFPEESLSEKPAKFNAKIYLVDNKGYVFVIDTKSQAKLKGYELGKEYTASYNLWGFLLNVK